MAFCHVAVRWRAAILHNVDYMTVCRICVLAKAYNTALCKIAWGWIFCGAFFGVCWEQLFGFCPRVSTFVRGGKRQCAAAGWAKNVTQKRRQKGWRGWGLY